MDQILIDIIAAIALGIASYTDLRWGKIWNWLTGPLMLAGLLLHTTIGQGWLYGVAGLGVAFALHFVLWIANVERAGDAKLAMGLGALLGWHFAVELTVWTLLLLFPIGIIVLVVRGRVRNLVAVFHHLAAKAQGVDVTKPPPLTFMAFGPTMAVAAILSRYTEWLPLW